MTIQLNLSKDTLMLDLTKVSPSLTNLRGTLNWSTHPRANQGYEFDLDIFMFLTSKGSIQGSMENVCFFNNKNCYNGAVILPRDNRDGTDAIDPATGLPLDDEEILVDIAKVPAHIDRIEHFVFLHEAEARGQDFSMIAGGSFDLYDQNDVLLASYKLQNFVNGSALHVGTLERTTNGWGFQPMGESAKANPNEVLQAFA